MLAKDQAIARLNHLGKKRTPFKFYCDFLGEGWKIETDESKPSFQLEIAEKCSPSQPLPPFEGHVSADRPVLTADSLEGWFEKKPIRFENFKKAFNEVVKEINGGNSFLTNLTFETPIQTNYTLSDIFQRSAARYKLLVPGQFVVFSPETFVKILDDHIYSYPMKGTIDEAIPHAQEAILNDAKERAEHITIVDLIRNDLSKVSKKVTVTKFRYIDRLQTHEKKLLQVSSEVRGLLGAGWEQHIGDILSQLLPAGSISGAPKVETLRIIQRVEQYKRGFYTGICGKFDGESLNTGVMIRFIKKRGDGLFFCSGGGITSFSIAEKEHQEMIDKVYLSFS